MNMPLPPILFRSLIVLLLTIAIVPTASAEETLGRLFFTPERRQALDRQRQLNIQDSKQVVEDPTLTINGMVTRSSGKRTSWINGAAQNENEMSGGTVIIPSKKERGVVEVQGGDLPAATARIGETVNRNTGEARDLLNDGRIVIKPSATK
jgi:hypothetical protein